ncbi:type II protein arginine methyltransferase [Fistulifera solaris]|uniref:Protein arginine N-methyltransferase n=1 Tax=Fistulifera solaris TaxID=1519565 RepID=A0A1Z5KJ22_FISSO|nr:type II protein arginine methyltransferase [Fistulifera solaris]|eukprot:GAX26300.1 type II protein arginine methyltransferase [Fistulifera solaris]
MTEVSLLLGYQDDTFSHDVAVALQTVRPESFDYVVTDLPHVGGGLNIQTRSDITVVEAKWWRTSVVGRCPGSIEEWPNYLPWAWHMNLPAVILPTPDDNIPQYSQQLASLALSALQEAGGSFQLWVPVSLDAASIRTWQKIISACQYPSLVGVLLEIPPIDGDPREHMTKQMTLLHNMIGCGPIKSFSIRTSLFLTNRQGYPTLAKPHQYIIGYLLKRLGRTLKVLLINDTAATNRGNFQQYLQHLRNRDSVTAVLDSSNAQDEHDYLDALQKPLQPLQDHLLFATYEVFEGDPIKYQRYQDACRSFLIERQAGTKTLVLVVGAGRGPLVTAVLQAYRASQSATLLRVIAVEKNPSAVLYLQSKQQFDPLWQQFKVQVVQSDLRSLEDQFCQQADLIVSELLGSFGCNELSPECLDTLLKRCRPDVVSVPTRYTSFLAPVSSLKLHQEVMAQSFYPDNNARVVGQQIAVETPYVVRTHAASQMFPEQTCWTFEHPTIVDDTSRKAKLVFRDNRGAIACGPGYGAVDEMVASSEVDTEPWIVTGLLGTFSADLSPDGVHKISIAPHSFSVGMFSWFPLYFPLQHPVHIPPQGIIDTSIWRKIDEKRVWYEWMATVMDADGNLLSTTPIHNPGGRSSHVSL